MMAEDNEIMTIADELIRAYPGTINADRELLARCISECFACAQACTACADACLSEKTIDELRKCIRTNLDCADICETTGRVLSRHTGYDANITRTILQACIQACRSCADECERHAGPGVLKHCRLCAEECRRCEQVCREVIAAIGERSPVTAS
jgi:hypothetical protein